jgi:hypothetical protein
MVPAHATRRTESVAVTERLEPLGLLRHGDARCPETPPHGLTVAGPAVTRPARHPVPSLAACVVLAVAWSSAHASGAPAASFSDATRAADCQILPRAAMRVRLTLDSDHLVDAAPAIREITTTAWAREGLDLRWTDDAPGAVLTWEEVDLWVLIRPEAASRRNPRAMGAVLFAGDAPHPLIRVSTDAVIAWVRRDTAALFRTAARTADLLALGTARDLVVQATGYTVAHEIGHYVLASRTHAREGLMAAVYERPRALATAAALSLDARSRGRLAERLARGAACTQPQTRIAGRLQR